MTFGYQPTLRSGLVELRPLCRADYEALYAVASDPLIWAQHPVTTRHEEPVFQDFFEDALNCGGTLIVSDVANQTIIGSSRFHGYDEEKDEIEIGWTFLARSHWGGLYNEEVKRLMLHHAFKFVQIVVLLVGPDNYRSQRAVEKIGGVRAGIRLDGGGRESIVYQVTKTEESGATK